MGLQLYRNDDHEPEQELFFLLDPKGEWFMIQGFYDTFPACFRENRL